MQQMKATCLCLPSASYAYGCNLNYPRSCLATASLFLAAAAAVVAIHNVWLSCSHNECLLLLYHLTTVGSTSNNSAPSVIIGLCA